MSADYLQEGPVRQDGWQRKTLGELADYINGYAFKPHDWGTTGLPIIRIAQLTDPEAQADCYSGSLPDTYRIDSGDLVFSWSATLLALTWDRGPAYLNQHLFKVVPAPGVNRRYLHHMLDHRMNDLAGQTHGTTMRHIKRSDLLPFPVEVPPSHEQHRIADILDTLDDAIRKTEEIIAKLQQAKRGLLHDLLTRGIDENGESGCRVSLGSWAMSSPEQEWAWERLGNLFQLQKRSITPAATPQELFCHHSIPAWDETGGPVLEAGGSIESGKTLVENPSILVSKLNPRKPRVGLVHPGTDTAQHCASTEFMVYESAGHRPWLPFYKWYFGSQAFQSQLERVAAGSTNSHVRASPGETLGWLIPHPSLAEQHRIADILDTLHDAIRKEQDESDNLRKLKRGLMDDLLTGRVRVPEAENAFA